MKVQCSCGYCGYLGDFAPVVKNVNCDNCGLTVAIELNCPDCDKVVLICVSCGKEYCNVQSE